MIPRPIKPVSCPPSASSLTMPSDDVVELLLLLRFHAARNDKDGELRENRAALLLAPPAKKAWHCKTNIDAKTMKVAGAVSTCRILLLLLLLCVKEEDSFKLFFLALAEVQ